MIYHVHTEMRQILVQFVPLVSEKCDVGFPKTIFSCLAAVTKVILTHFSLQPF